MFKKYTHFWAKTRRKALRLPWTRRTKLSKVNKNQEKCEDLSTDIIFYDISDLMYMYIIMYVREQHT